MWKFKLARKSLNILKLEILLNTQNRNIFLHNIFLHNHSTVVIFCTFMNNVILFYYLQSVFQFSQLTQSCPLYHFPASAQDLV